MSLETIECLAQIESRGGTIAVDYLRVVLEQAQGLGIDCTGLLEEVGVVGDVLRGNGRISQDKAYALWRGLEARDAHEGTGLRLAMRLPAGSFAVLDYVVRNSPTLGEACRHFVRYSRLVHSGAFARFDANEQRQEATLSYRVGAFGNRLPRSTAEFVVGTWLFITRQITNTTIIPKQVRFQHEKPKNLAAYEEVFLCPLVFGAQSNEMVISDLQCALPILSADARLKSVLDQYADELLARLPAMPGFKEIVYHLIHEGFAEGRCTLEQVANRAKMSSRTLQRRLGDLGSSFQQLVDEVRRGLAENYLRNRKISVGETAFLLGFSEPSAFHRAFKRWTNTTPGEFRFAALNSRQ